MTLKYFTGEEIRKGDRIRSDNDFGVIEFIADPAVSSPETAWYVQTCGEGVMLRLDNLGAVYAGHPEKDDELELVSRLEGGPDLTDPK
jgi:hypothetical protein